MLSGQVHDPYIVRAPLSGAGGWPPGTRDTGKIASRPWTWTSWTRVWSSRLRAGVGPSDTATLTWSARSVSSWRVGDWMSTASRAAPVGLTDAQLGLVLLVQHLGLGAGGGHRLLEQVGLLEGGQQRVDDDLVEQVGAQPLGRAGLGAVALPGEAHIVGVAVQLAVGGGPHERLAAPLAAHPAGEQVFGGVAGALGVGVAAPAISAPAASKVVWSTTGRWRPGCQVSRKNTSPRGRPGHTARVEVVAAVAERLAAYRGARGPARHHPEGMMRSGSGRALLPVVEMSGSWRLPGERFCCSFN